MVRNRVLDVETGIKIECCVVLSPYARGVRIYWSTTTTTLVELLILEDWSYLDGIEFVYIVTIFIHSVAVRNARPQSLYKRRL